MTTQLAFTRRLYNFLKEEGYTHIRLMGVSTNERFTMVPLKESVSDKFEEVDFKIEEIDSTEVTDMLYPMLGLEFYVELPAELAEKYQKNLN